ncbi:hypothetical protein QBC47DRAFT_336340 [Echria macrotheca]|uniref:F-box domain-containing protein n=1 Tax=Echria macrotheca TaxID=438768 RepID=A0AAJ0BMW8_9PEZI|nr:hypothetical protein QBC47DRAFT_336340 [Echria macrotheca]
MAKRKNDVGGEETNKKPRTTGDIDLQQASLFFRRFPQEIRDNIYRAVFESTRLRSATEYYLKKKPALNSLALLRTCRRVKMEIGTAWLGWVRFYFEDTEALLDKLTPLPINTLSQLRRVTVSGETLHLVHPGLISQFRLVSVLKLLPGLRLDELTVIGGPDYRVCYDALNGLIDQGSGWKVLRYITFASEMLGLPENQHGDNYYNYYRDAQPSHWQAMLENRDGILSRPSVTIYRATQPAQHGKILDPTKRVKYEQKPFVNSEEFLRDFFLMADGERNKEMMVVVKRGAGVDYEEKGEPALRYGDIYEGMEEKTWEFVRRTCLDFSDDEDDDYPFSDEEDDDYSSSDEEDDTPYEARDLIQYDTYRDADEYVWHWFWFYFNQE